MRTYRIVQFKRLVVNAAGYVNERTEIYAQRRLWVLPIWIRLHSVALAGEDGAWRLIVADARGKPHKVIGPYGLEFRMPE